MYQLHHKYTSEAEFRIYLDQLRGRFFREQPSQILFHVYNDTYVRDATETIAAMLRETMPEAQFLGCSTTANLSDGELVEHEDGGSVTVICDVFEDAATRVEVLQFPLDYDTQQATADALVQAVEERPWVKAVEMLTTIVDVHMPDFCRELSRVPEDIVFFGGGALCSESMDMYSCLPYVFSSSADSGNHNVVFVLYGGLNFHAQTKAITGWKPLGMPFSITNSEHATLYELDGKPAYDMYYHYLKVANDDNFFQNSLLFPLSFDHDGMLVIKAAVAANADGSLTMTSDLTNEQRECRIAYGDPATILRSIKDTAANMRVFNPDAVLIYSCASRLLYWGPEYVSRETKPFNAIGPAAGFFTSSEFARHHGELLQYNVTLVIAGMREGMPAGASKADIDIDDKEFSRQMSMVTSLTSFVGTTSAELQEAYDRMELMAKTDGLTGLCNRKEIEERIDAELERAAAAENASTCVIMCDIDDFKRVNDSFGHREGDAVLKAIGKLLTTTAGNASERAAAGRWGGEEFMVLLPDTSLGEAQRVAEAVRVGFSALRFDECGYQTLSLGVAQARPGEDTDALCIRVDDALYEAKGSGKNRVVTAE